MVARLPFVCTSSGGLRPGAAWLWALYLSFALSAATRAPAAEEPAAAAPQLTSAYASPAAAQIRDVAEMRTFGPPRETPGVPADEVLEQEGARVGEVLIDNQNIFDLADPKDDNGLFRLADRLHIRTRAGVVRAQLLFKPGDRYSHRLVEESERLLRANSYFYDAWIRPVRYHDGKVDLRVTTRDVWTINPGFNYSRSGGTNSTGAQIGDSNILGSGAALTYVYTDTVDRSGSVVQFSDRNTLDSWVAVNAAYGDYSDGHLRLLNITQPFYALDSRWAATLSGLDDIQTDPLYDRGEIVDQFQDHHAQVQASYGWSSGLHDGWVQRWSGGLAYDEHLFAPVTNSLGTTNLLPEDRRFLYPFIEWDLLEDDYLKFWNHDQIARTEDFSLGMSASVRLGYASAQYGSSASALLMSSSVSRGFRQGGSTLLLAGDFSGRLEDGTLQNGVMDGSVRYYVVQSKNWLFFSTASATKGWNLDLDNQILLGGDNGLRGYPLRYQNGTARALFTVEERYFTDWYLLRLLRVGGAIFYDMGRTWGSPPLAQPSLGLLKDVGFGLRFGNARSGLGNVIHVDLAFPLDGEASIARVQFLVSTQATF